MWGCGGGPVRCNGRRRTTPQAAAEARSDKALSAEGEAALALEAWLNVVVLGGWCPPTAHGHLEPQNAAFIGNRSLRV